VEGADSRRQQPLNAEARKGNAEARRGEQPITATQTTQEQQRRIRTEDALGSLRVPPRCLSALRDQNVWGYPTTFGKPRIARAGRRSGV